jgi:hypothetical protein
MYDVRCTMYDFNVAKSVTYSPLPLGEGPGVRCSANEGAGGEVLNFADHHHSPIRYRIKLYIFY